MQNGKGPGRGRGAGQRRKRGGGRQRKFFLQSCLLVLLHRRPGYGYSLMDDLQIFGFEPDQMDISIIYRALRNLQAEGLISDTWDDNSLGPQRRVYTLTPNGEEILAEWMEGLKQRRIEIDALEAAYDEVRNKDNT